MATLEIKTFPVFEPLCKPSRYRGAWGGRGSGKSHFFAEALIEECLAVRGTRAVCIREVQKTLKESSKRLIEDKLSQFKIGSRNGFKSFHDCISTPGDGLISFIGMQAYNADNIKSLTGIRIAWVEEAQTLSARSLEVLKPTIREDGSEMWFSWNPRRNSDAVDKLLRGAELPSGATIVRANWSDNPEFPGVLEVERQDCLRLHPEQYDHVWEGGYVQALEGAYYCQALALAQAEQRIGRVKADPSLSLRVFCDIGGTGGKADAYTMWVCQFVGREVRVLDYYEAVGQPIATHLTWLRERKYTSAHAGIWLPHDGDSQDRVFDISYASAFRAAGYEVEVIPNQGKGAAMARIEAGRKLFPSCYFHEETTKPGLDALGWYHEKRNDVRRIGLGPEHDWSSHGADSFGLMAIVAEKHFSGANRRRVNRPEAPKHVRGYF